MTDQATMTTIRTAYRYVVAYQRRVLDAVAVFEEAMSGLGYTFDQWDPLYFDHPNKRDVTKWAWDFSPMYSTRFYWGSHDKPQNAPGFSVVFLDHIVDTGFEQLKRKTGQEPDPFDLPAVAATDSLFRGCWLHLQKEVREEHWKLESWEKVLAAHFKVPINELWRPGPTPQPVTRDVDGLVMGSYVVSIADIADRAEFGTKFVTPIVNELRALRGLTRT